MGSRLKRPDFKSHSSSVKLYDFGKITSLFQDVEFLGENKWIINELILIIINININKLLMVINKGEMVKCYPIGFQGRIQERIYGKLLVK